MSADDQEAPPAVWRPFRRFHAGRDLFAAGIATGLWGVILAALQNDMKKIRPYPA
ncbi:MAG: hypothetical protein ACLT1W_12340 [Alistipes onderdonkii]